MTGRNGNTPNGQPTPAEPKASIDAAEIYDATVDDTLRGHTGELLEKMVAQMVQEKGTSSTVRSVEDRSLARRAKGRLQAIAVKRKTLVMSP